jgi:hypothetical protein
VTEPDAPARPARGNLWAYGAAFVLVLVSAYVQFKGNVKSSLPLVRISIGLSGLALALAVLSLFLPAGRARPVPGPHEDSSEVSSEAGG